jgi:hypothetical protein
MFLEAVILQRVKGRALVALHVLLGIWVSEASLVWRLHMSGLMVLVMYKEAWNKGSEGNC